MRTPSLQRRAVAYGVATVGVTVTVLSALVYVALAASLDSSINDALAMRQTAAFEAARRTRDVTGLAEELSQLGIPATVRAPSDVATAAPIVRSRPGEELILSSSRDDLAAASIQVPGAREVTVFVNRSGATETLRRLVLFEALAAVVSMLTAYLLLRRGTAAALAPLDEVVAAAQRTAEGHTGQRLDADDPRTELGRLAIAYDHMLDELEDALTEARDAEERGRRFLADAAHQLRTPLASIRAGVELLLIEPDPRRRDDHLAHLLRETTRGTKVLNALLTLARLDRGRPLDLDTFDLAEVCRDEAERARSLAPHLAISISAPSQDTEIVGSADAIQEALANLLDNARRHATRRIDITLSVADGEARVHVRDDGAGIPPDARELVFERFATLDGKGGSGLGLPIARAVARGHGGDLRYADDGFTLTLTTVPPPMRRD